MTSKIVVNNIEADAGVSTVTFNSNVERGTSNLHSVGLEAAGSNVLGADTPIGSGSTIYDDGGARFSGIVTATSFSGDGSSLTGVGASFGNSSINTSGIITATAFVPTTGQLSHRNLIINGAMTISQRGQSSTSPGYKTVDRFKYEFSGTDEAPTQEQVDVASGTTPYSLGFRKAYKITNGNQTSGAGAADYVGVEQRIEAQNVVNSGWNYTSPSSFVTLSFWVKSSVAQNFYGYLFTEDGAERLYSFETGSLTADTWTKITKTIPGNSIVQINNDNGFGLQIQLWAFLGTNYTASGSTLNQWKVWNGSERIPDMTSTWYTTNDATFEITGMQLEVGPVATPFEHLSASENKRRCYRYCQRGRHISSCLVGTPGTYYFSRGYINLFTPMRATISGTLKAATWNSNRYFKYMTWSSETNVTAAPATVTFSSGNISDASSDIVSLQLHISISSGSSNSPLPANGPGSNNVYPIEYFDVLLEAEL